LMISFPMVMRHVLLNRVTQRCLAKENHAAQTFGFYRAHKSFRPSSIS